MSRVVFNFPGYEDNSAGDLAKQIDQSLFSAIRRDAGIKETVTADTFIQELTKAMEIINTPDYYLLANPEHKVILDEFVKTTENVLFKTLYSPILGKNEIIVVKYGAVAYTPYMVSDLPYFVSPEATVINPNEVRLFEVK